MNFQHQSAQATEPHGSDQRTFHAIAAAAMYVLAVALVFPMLLPALRDSGVDERAVGLVLLFGAPVVFGAVLLGGWLRSRRHAKRLATASLHRCSVLDAPHPRLAGIRDRLSIVDKRWAVDGRYVFEVEQSAWSPPERGGLVAEVDERLAPLIAHAPADLRALLAAIDAVDACLDQEPAGGTVPVAEIRHAIDNALHLHR
ncbi:hypothetical protein V6N00_13125 [Tersicoccus sp. MR15.9]|uniref:hypothetical protein n=1 Tax=Tersicoccus mangrovi TaxID=3121635 RepID=UPI002FE64337